MGFPFGGRIQWLRMMSLLRFFFLLSSGRNVKIRLFGEEERRYFHSLTNRILDARFGLLFRNTIVPCNLVPDGIRSVDRFHFVPLFFVQLTEEQGVAAIVEFGSCDMSRIRNKRYGTATSKICRLNAVMMRSAEVSGAVVK